VVVDMCRSWKGSRAAPVQVDLTLDQIAILAAAYGHAAVSTDQYAAQAISQGLRRRGVGVLEQPWTNELKLSAYTELRRLFAGRAIELPDQPGLVAELLMLEQTVLPSGRPRIAAPAGRHDDHAAALAALFVAAIGLGLRQGELLALRWEDVDLDRGIVMVRHTLRRGDRELAEPKTERSRRTLAMPSAVTAALRQHRRRQLEERLAAGPAWEDREFVFATPHGRPLDGVNVAHDYQEALARAGLPRQRFHDLRHAYATLLLEDGVELAIISRALGHSVLSTTADVYGAWTRDMAGRVAASMDGVLRRQTG
jgi:integrase